MADSFEKLSIRVLHVQEESDWHYSQVAAFLIRLGPEIEVVKHLNTGRSAITEAPLLRPDIVLTRWGLPDINAATLASKLLKILPDLPILAMTSTGDPALMINGWIHGVNQFVDLPTEPHILLGLIKFSIQYPKIYQTKLIDEHLGGQFPISTIVIHDANNMPRRDNTRLLFQHFRHIRHRLHTMSWRYEGKKGLQDAQWLEPEVVVIDTDITDVYELVEAFAKLRPTPSIVLLGREFNSEYIKKANRSRRHAYLKYPFTADELLSTIESVHQIK